MISIDLTTLFRDTEHRLKTAGVATPELDVRLLVEEALGLTRVEALTLDQHQVTELDLKRLAGFIEKRLDRMPVSKIIGRREFWSLDFIVTKDTLDPRADSETLIDAVLSKRKNHTDSLRILDVGTGSGCLSIALLKEYPNARGVAVDISRETLQVALRNAEMHKVSDRLKLELGYWATYVEGTFDVIISNPPYIGLSERESLEPEVVNYDPPHALFAGEQGLDAYKELAETSFACLKDEGFVAYEHGFGQHEQVEQILREVGFSAFEGRCDLSGTRRVILAAKSKKALEQQ